MMGHIIIFLSTRIESERGEKNSRVSIFKKKKKSILVNQDYIYISSGFSDIFLNFQ